MIVVVHYLHRPLFPALPDRTRLFRLFAAHREGDQAQYVAADERFCRDCGLPLIHAPGTGDGGISIATPRSNFRRNSSTSSDTSPYSA